MHAPGRKAPGKRNYPPPSRGSDLPRHTPMSCPVDVMLKNLRKNA